MANLTRHRFAGGGAATVLLTALIGGNVAAAEDSADKASTETDTASSKGGLNHNPLSGPDSAASLVEEFRQEKADVLDKNLLEQWGAWKEDVTQKTGLSFGADYTAVGLAASSSPGDDSAASGIARFYGGWGLINPGSKNTGSIQFKIEHRHKYTDVPPIAFGVEVGYVGTPEPVFNDDGYRTTELNWKQYFMDDRAVTRVGFIDVKSYFDVYALASPWSGFHNLAFSTGSNTMASLPDGSFGAMFGSYLSNHTYVVVGIADASADPTDVFDGFDTFFNDFDTFKTIEFGISGGGKKLFVDNAHIAFWQLDDIEATGAQGGWGVNLSASKLVNGKWLPFIRGGWAHEGGGVYEASVSAGVGHMSEPGGSLLGMAINWGKPNSDTFPIDLNDQWTSEVFYRVQLLENMQITPSVQLLIDPALNPDKDFIALFGLRMRLQF